MSGELQEHMPAIPEDREVGPYSMQTIWKRVRSVLGKRKQCIIAPLQAQGSKECKELGAYVAKTTASTRIVVAPDTIMRRGLDDQRRCRG